MPGDAEGFWLLLGVLLPHPFCVYDRLPCFALLLKTVLTILCVWILTFPFMTLLLRRDEGDDPEHELFWQEDPEPQPCVIDCWAEGSVPVLHAAQE